MKTFRLVSMFPTEKFAWWQLVCPVCDYSWEESTHDLWNVAALMCPGCRVYLGVGDCDFHGDDNSPQG